MVSSMRMTRLCSAGVVSWVCLPFLPSGSFFLPKSRHAGPTAHAALGHRCSANRPRICRSRRACRAGRPSGASRPGQARAALGDLDARRQADDAADRGAAGMGAAPQPAQAPRLGGRRHRSRRARPTGARGALELELEA
jgi:hypothetical protein